MMNTVSAFTTSAQIKLFLQKSILLEIIFITYQKLKWDNFYFL